MDSIIEEVLIPKQRVAVLIGKQGETKKKIEKKCGVRLNIDSKTGLVIIERTPNSKEALNQIKAKEVIKAVARGFSPQKAFKLLTPNYYLEIIDLTEFVSDKSLKRVKSRIIGREGKSKKMIMSKTKTDISIYGKTVALIGDAESIKVAEKAIKKLIAGAKHATVFNFLVKNT